jgi:hypothetical protein
MISTLIHLFYTGKRPYFENGKDDSAYFMQRARYSVVITTCSI